MIKDVMRTFLLDEFEAALCSGRADHCKALGARELHRRGSNSTTSAVHEKCFSRASMRMVMKCGIRSSIGNPQSRALCEGDFFWQRVHLRFQGQSIFGVR